MTIETFKKNLINLYGDPALIWFLKLEKILSSLQKHWSLKKIEPHENMTYHFIGKTYDQNNTPLILKIGYEKKWIDQEAKTLKYFHRQGSVHLLDQHPEYPALLLQQAVPGKSLKSFYPNKISFVMDQYVQTVKELHEKRKIDLTFQGIEAWLQSIDNMSADFLTKAKKLKEEMLSTMKNQMILHGDLHLDNILQNGKNWLVIDPKGVIGDLEFELAAFDFITSNEIKTASEKKFLKRIEILSQKADVSFERLKNWVYLRLILSAVWSIEDKNDPKKALYLASLLESSLKD